MSSHTIAHNEPNRERDQKKVCRSLWEKQVRCSSNWSEHALWDWGPVNIKY